MILNMWGFTFFFQIPLFFQRKNMNLEKFYMINIILGTCHATFYITSKSQTSVGFRFSSAYLSSSVFLSVCLIPHQLARAEAAGYGND